MIYFCFVLGPTLFWAIMTIFLQKFHFLGLNFTVFENEGPSLPKNSQIGSIIVGKKCLPWKVDDYKFLQLPKMLSGLQDMPILSKDDFRKFLFSLFYGGDSVSSLGYMKSKEWPKTILLPFYLSASILVQKWSQWHKYQLPTLSV